MTKGGLPWWGCVLGLLTVFMLAFSLFLPVSTGAPSTGYNIQSAGWLVCVYMCADNNLEGPGIEDINEMEAATDSTSVDIIVLVDRYDGAAVGDWASDDTSNGNWTGAKIIEIEHDTDAQNITSNTLSNEGELNMGDPDVLVGFMDWSMTNYARDNVLLVLWDHGGGWTGVCFDDDSDDHLTDVELDSALYDITSEHGNISVIAFDACLMATTEILYSVWSYCDYMVASQETEPGDGYPYEEILDALAASPTMTPRSLASMIVDEFILSYTDGKVDPYDSSEVTSSAFDLGVAGPFLNDFNTLAYYLYYELYYQNGTMAGILEDLRPDVEEFGQNPKDPDYDQNLIDLLDFWDWFYIYTDDSWAQGIIEDLFTDYYTMLVNEDHGSQHTYAYGLSIYFPESSLIYNSKYDDTLLSTYLYWYFAIDSYYYFSPNTAPRIDLEATSPSPFNTLDYNYIPIENTETLDFDLVADDADGDTIYYYWYYSYYDVASGTWDDLIYLDDLDGASVTFSPAAETEDTLFLEVVVSDGDLSDYCYWIVIVSDNTAPELVWSVPSTYAVEIIADEHVGLMAEIDDYFETSVYLEMAWWIDDVLIEDEYDIEFMEEFIQDYVECTYVVLAYMNYTTTIDDVGVHIINLTVSDEEWILTISWTVTVLADTDGDGTPDIRDDDDDNDGMKDLVDEFPLDPAAWLDTDNDGMPDFLNGTSTTGLIEDADDDNDGALDILDAFPTDPAASIDTDGDGMPDALNGTSTTGLVEDLDDDNDGTPDLADAFPLDLAAWLDTDGDGKPDSITGTSTTGLMEDDDDDNDDVIDELDAFPLDPAATLDTDRDGKPDSLKGKSTTGLVEDNDDDNDGTPDVTDAFPLDPAADIDTDRDGRPDILTRASTTGLVEDTDDDDDGVLDEMDAFPLDPAADTDTDGDGRPDVLDGSSTTGLMEDDDDDGDGVSDVLDAFPKDPAATIDTDGDGRPDSLTGPSTTGLKEDKDDDGDGVTDLDDAFPLDPGAFRDTDGDGLPDALTGTSTTGLVEDDDDDNDGILDSLDAFPLDPAAWKDTDGDGKPDDLVGESTTGLVEDDNDDNDDVLDIDDAFPLDQSASVDTDHDGKPDLIVGESTTGLVQDDDNDNDGVLNPDDAFPLDAAASMDTDRDGKPDELIGFSSTGLTEDDDDDNDLVPDASDAFPKDKAASVDTDKDGMPDTLNGTSTTGLVEDTDDDNDNVPDAKDKFPIDPNRGKEEDEGFLAISHLSIMVMLTMACVAVLLRKTRTTQID